MARPTVTLQRNGDALFRFPYDPVFVALVKERLPRHGRAWRPEERAWWVAAPHVDQVCRWFGEFFPGAEYVDAPRAGYRAHTAPPPPPPPKDDPYRVLHLLPSAPVELVEAAGRTLARLNHPDLKPEGERALATVRMQVINAAVDRVRRLRQEVA